MKIPPLTPPQDEDILPTFPKIKQSVWKMCASATMEQNVIMCWKT